MTNIFTPYDNATLERLDMELSDEDNAKITRGQKHGTFLGQVTDLKTGKKMEAYQASCGGDNCNCDVAIFFNS